MVPNLAIPWAKIPTADSFGGVLEWPWTPFTDNCTFAQPFSTTPIECTKKLLSNLSFGLPKLNPCFLRLLLHLYSLT